MNVTMPAPAPTAPPTAPPAAASNDRVVARVHPKSTSTTASTGLLTEDERTFEDQLDEVAVALGSAALPKPVDAPSKAPPSAGPTPIVATAAIATPVTTAPSPLTPTADTPTAAALGAPPAAMAAVPTITEIEGPTTPPATSPTTPPSVATGVPAGTGEAPTATTTDPAPAGSATTDPGAPGSLPPTTSVTGPTDDSAEPAVAQLPSPLDSGLITTTATPAMPATAISAADPATSPAVLGAMVDAVVDTVDAEIETPTDAAEPPLADPSTPLVITNPASSGRRDDSSATRIDGPPPAIAEAADELPAPLRVAPPRTIAVDLNDEGLGPLRVVATTEQRTVNLTVSAAEAVVRDALVRQQADLRHDLADAGLQLGSFEVDARAADRDNTDQPAPTGDRQTAKTAGGLAVAPPVHRTHDADGRLDLRL